MTRLPANSPHHAGNRIFVVRSAAWMPSGDACRAPDLAGSNEDEGTSI